MQKLWFFFSFFLYSTEISRLWIAEAFSNWIEYSPFQFFKSRLISVNSMPDQKFSFIFFFFFIIFFIAEFFFFFLTLVIVLLLLACFLFFLRSFFSLYLFCQKELIMVFAFRQRLRPDRFSLYRKFFRFIYSSRFVLELSFFIYLFIFFPRTSKGFN